MHSECNDVLQKQINKVTKQLKEEKMRTEQKEREIKNLKIELLGTALALEKKDNYYKDEVRKVEKQRDAIRADLADVKCHKMEEENQRVREELEQLKSQKNN